MVLVGVGAMGLAVLGGIWRGSSANALGVRTREAKQWENVVDKTELDPKMQMQCENSVYSLLNVRFQERVS